MPDATLTSKGQITLPLEIRRKLGLKSGDKVNFIEDPEGSYRILVKRPLDEMRHLLPKPRKKVSLEEMEEAINKGWAGEIDI